MISSDLHGAEEPIRWTLGWQMQDRVYDEPMEGVVFDVQDHA